MKRRTLVLTNEAARHPFRQTLPPHVLRPLTDVVKRNDQDVRLFLVSFTAFFMAFYSFIA
jgi:hypothetical protein